MAWKVTIKVLNESNPIVVYHGGNISYDKVKNWFGCEEPDVEWYKIEEIYFYGDDDGRAE